MAGITRERLIGNRGPNTAQLLSFFDDITAMTDEQAARLDAAFRTYDMDRWQHAANAGVAIAGKAGVTRRTAWYLARHATEQVVHDRGFTNHSFAYHIGYVGAAICYRDRLTEEQFTALTAPWTDNVSPL